MRDGQHYSKTLMSVATAAVSSLTALSATWEMDQAAGFALQTEWGVNLTGTFQIYERVHTAASWVENTTISLTSPAASAASVVYDNIGAIAPYWKLVFTYTSGTTGPLNAWLYVKEMGA